MARKQRQPVVVIMGHVDHGKTTLLDAIRKTNVAAREAGGITQAVSAYEIEQGGKKLSFIDTPGHEAFMGMRSRGAKMADLAVLVVAGTEGVKPQTAESIKILKETETPFVVAITKMDMPGANEEKIKAELAAHEVLLEGYGGSVSFQPVSAVTGEGVTDLIDLLLLAAEVEDFSYDPDLPGSGFVLEAKVNRKRGNEAVLIVKEGTLKFGADIATETAKGKVKMLEDFSGKGAREIPAGAPALIVGIETLPATGEEFRTGGEASTAYQPKEREFAEPDYSDDATFPVVLKAADAGSLEVLSQIVRAMESDPPVKVVAESVGEINDNDIKMAIPPKAVIVGFKTKTDKAATTLADAHKITVLSSEIIYELTQGLEALFKAAGGPAVAASLEVLAVFNQKELHEQLVGGRIDTGTFRIKAPFEIRRDGKTVANGRILSLRQQKQKIEEASAVTEIGLLVSAPIAIETGDTLAILER